MAHDRDDQPELLPSADPAEAAAPSPTDHAAAHLAKGERRPDDTIWRANPREQGLLGFTDAIQYFGRLGWSINVPLIDSQPYDLVVDDGQHLHRVQVKTTTFRSEYGVFAVQLCTNGGNQSFHTRKVFDPSGSDLLYILTDARDRYVIPTKVVTAKTKLNLGRKMARYRL